MHAFFDATGKPIGTGTDAGGNADWLTAMEGNFSGEYVTPMFGHQGFVQADLSTRAHRLQRGVRPAARVAGCAIVERVGLRSDDGKWGVSLFVRISPTPTRAVRFATPTAAQHSTASLRADVGPRVPPRRWPFPRCPFLILCFPDLTFITSSQWFALQSPRKGAA